MGGDRETQAVQNLTARGRRVENNPKVYPRIPKLKGYKILENLNTTRGWEKSPLRRKFPSPQTANNPLLWKYRRHIIRNRSQGCQFPKQKRWQRPQRQSMIFQKERLMATLTDASLVGNNRIGCKAQTESPFFFGVCVASYHVCAFSS